MSDIYNNGGDGMAQFDPNIYVTKEDLESNGKGVFWATYNETSRDDILDAFLHGKIIALKEELSSGAVNTAFMLERNNNDTLEFCTAINPNNAGKYIYYSVDSSNAWTRSEKSVGSDILLVAFNTIPGVGWRADKTFDEITMALNSGKDVFGIMGSEKAGLIITNASSGNIKFASLKFREFDGSGIGQLKNASYPILTLNSDNTVTESAGFVVGQKRSFLASEFEIVMQEQVFALANNASYFIINNGISNADLTITIIAEDPDSSPDTDITIMCLSGSISRITVNFITASGTVSINPIPPDDSVSVLTSGSHFGIRITGYFWTITKLS